MSLPMETKCEARITFSSQHEAYRTDMGPDVYGNEVFTRPQINQSPTEVSLSIACQHCGFNRELRRNPDTSYGNISNQFGILLGAANLELALNCPKANGVPIVEAETNEAPVTPLE